MDKFTKRELSIIGAVLYSCELFLKFLRKIIKIDEGRLKAQLFIHRDLNKGKLEKIWSKTTDIPLRNFNKTIVLQSKNLKFKLSPYGTLKIRYHSKEAFQKLTLLINKVFK